MKKIFSIKSLAVNGVVAALYVVLTYALQSVSYGPIQFRLSEIMTLLAWINPHTIPGLIIGCLIANIFSPFGIIDMIVGTTASAIAVIAISKTKNLWLASLWPTISCLLIAAEICTVSNVWNEFHIVAGQILLSEFVVVTVIGVPVVKVIQKTPIYRIVRGFN